mgnify:CR=1 FL=1
MSVRTVASSIAPLSMEAQTYQKNANKLAMVHTQGDNPGAYTPANTLPGDAATRKETHNSKSKSPPAHKVVLASRITPPAHMVALAQGYTPAGSQSRTARIGQGHPPGSLTRPTHSPCGPYPPH